MREFAYPLPVTVIAELLGFPACDSELFALWSRDLLIDTGGPTIDDPELLCRARQAKRELGRLPELFARAVGLDTDSWVCEEVGTATRDISDESEDNLDALADSASAYSVMARLA